MRYHSLVVLLAALALAPPASAGTALRCSGTEPFWRLDAEDGTGTLRRPGRDGVVETPLSGTLRRLDFMDPAWIVWRGTATGDTAPAGALVATLRREACHDAMSGKAFDHRVVVSFPEAPATIGCCTVQASPAGSWTVAALMGSPVAVPPESTLTLHPDGAVSGNGGCNRFTGTAAIDGEAIAFGPLAATRMACAPPAMEREQRYFEALEAAERWRLDGGRLVLEGGSGTVVLEAEPAR